MGTATLTRRSVMGVAAALCAPRIAAAQAEPVRIGLIMPTKTVIGQQGQQGAEIAQDMLNEAGGLPGGRRLQLITYDSAMQPVTGVAAVQRLISQDRVRFIVGEIGSTVALAALQVIRASDAMFIAAIPKHPDLTRLGYGKVFRMNTTLDADAEHDNRLIAQADPSRIAVVAENTDYGRYVAGSMRAQFGPKLVASELTELTQTDFSTTMTKVRASGAELVCLVMGQPEQIATAMRAMRMLAVQARLFGAVGVISRQAVRLAGPAAEGAFGSDIYVSSIQNPLNEAFVRRFQAKFNRVPEKVEALSFETVWLTGKGMIAAESVTDTGKVAEALHKGAWQTPRGEIRFNAGGQALFDSYYGLLVRDGELVVTGT